MGAGYVELALTNYWFHWTQSELHWKVSDVRSLRSVYPIQQDWELHRVVMEFGSAFTHCTLLHELEQVCGDDNERL